MRRSTSGSKSRGLDPPVTMPRDPQLDAPCLLQVAVEDELGLVVQVVDDDVVAGFQVERVGDDVLALAGREQEADLVGDRP